MKSGFISAAILRRQHHAPIIGQGDCPYCLQSDVDQVKRYIVNQEEHHKRMSFQDEFRDICNRHGIEIDERYVWD